MKSQTSFVRSDRTVELYTVSCVNMYLSVVVNPWHTEFELSFRLNKSFQKCIFTELLLICFYYYSQGFQYFFDCLVKFRLCRIFLYN